MFIRALKQVDLLPAFEILSQYDLPTNALDIDNLEGFWVAEEEGRIIGVGGIDLKKHVGLVRLIAVDKYYQGEGVGKTLYDNIEEYARNMRAIDLYLLTTIAEQYFNKLGYEAIERDLAPLPIQKSTQFIALCPQSVTLMQKSLNLVQGRREFDTGLFCAESILTTVAEYYGIQSQLIPVIATGLCSGMGRTCGTCGALTGGILAVNLIYGRKSEYESVEKNYEAVQELVHGFTELFGTTNCAELLGCDIGTEAGQLTFTHKKLHRGCREYTGIAAELSIKAIENIKE